VIFRTSPPPPRELGSYKITLNYGRKYPYQYNKHLHHPTSGPKSSVVAYTKFKVQVPINNIQPGRRLFSKRLKCGWRGVTPLGSRPPAQYGSPHSNVNRSPLLLDRSHLSHRPLLVGLLPLSLSILLGLLLPPGVWGGAMIDLRGSGELSVSVASSLARMPLRMCRGVWLMGAQMYA
jgi:hypothetical protein